MIFELYTLKSVVLNIPNAVTVPHVVVTPPTIKLFHNRNFATIVNCKVNILGDKGLQKGLQPTG